MTTFLSQRLGSYVTNERQGSYALDTIIKPVSGGEFDADILLFMKHVRRKRAPDYIDELYACLHGNPDFADKLRKKTRCVTVKYAGDFSLDVVPCIAQGNQRRICNRVRTVRAHRRYGLPGMVQRENRRDQRLPERNGAPAEIPQGP